MADERWNVMTVSEGKDGKKYYTKVGVMFRNATKESGEEFFSIALDAVPVNGQLVCFAPREKTENDDGRGGVSRETQRQTTGNQNRQSGGNRGGARR